MTEPVDYLAPPSVHLPAGLLTVLQLKAEGHTAWEIAHQLGVSHDEIRSRAAPPDQSAEGRRVNDMRTAPLTQTLQVAVPLWVAVAADQDEHGRAGLLERWRQDSVDVIAGNGDNILFRGPKRGDTAAAFNHLARGLAALAHLRGGVPAFGLIWCAVHSPDGASTDGRLCARCLSDDRRDE